MQRTETYCDRCGNQMSQVDYDGDPHVYGYTLTIDDGFGIHRNDRSECGSSGFAEYFRGKHFCSNECLTGAFLPMLETLVNSRRDAPVEVCRGT